MSWQKTWKPIKSVQNEDKIKDLIDRYEKTSDSDLEYSDSENFQPTSKGPKFGLHTTVAEKTVNVDKTSKGIENVDKTSTTARSVVYK